MAHKLQVRFVEKKDCYISLPLRIGSLTDQNYSEQAICRQVRLTRFNKEKIYVGYAAGVSKQENEIEISRVFAQCLGLEEGEPVDIEILGASNTEVRLELYVTNADYYEMVCSMQDKFEQNLLNQISVIYPGLKFPAYYSDSQYVLFEFKGNGDDHSGKMISPQAELIILSPAEEISKSKQSKQQKNKKQNEDQENDNQFQDIADSDEDIDDVEFLRLRTCQIYGENDYRLYISKRVFTKYKIAENKLYRLSMEKIIKESDYTDFKTFLNKQQRAQKVKNPEDKQPNSNNQQKLKKSEQCMILIGYKEEIEDDNLIYFNEFMQKALGINTKSIVQIDLKYELDNIKDNRILSLHDFMSPSNKIKLIFRQIYGQNGKEDLPVDHSLILAQIINRFQRAQQDIYYTNQIYVINGNYYILKILEIMQESKETLKMILFENNSSSLQSSLNKSSLNLDSSQQGQALISDTARAAQIIQENPQHAQSITNNLIFVSQQDFFQDFHDKDIVNINKLVKSKLSVDPFQKVKLGIYDVLYSSELKKLSEFLAQKHSDCNLEQKNQNQSVMCIQGKSQNGKTYTCEYIKQKYPEYYIEYLDFAELQEQVLLDYAKNYIATKIQIACIKKPSIFICDNIERMCKNLDRIDFQQFQLILVSEIISKYLKDQIKKYSHANPRVKFIFLTESKEIINSNLPKIIDVYMNLEIANYAKRKQLFEYIHNTCKIEMNVDELGSSTENFTLNEFFILAQKIYQEQTDINHNQILQKISDLSNKSFKSSKNFPKFEHVGGLLEVKDTIRETFEVPIKYDFLFKNIPIKLPRGVLLYGPPGCGKTYLAKATANELGLNFFSVKGPEILNKYIGASEQAVRDVFEKAYSVRPSIVFFDEFDAIVPRRNSGSTGVTDRVVNQFLCYLDGVASLEGVCILAASSRPDLIDPALLRPGRIDRHVYLGFPSVEERKDILQIYGKNLKMGDDLSFEDLIKVTENFTSSDIVAFLKEIRIKMAHDMIEEKKQNENFEFDFTLTKQFFEKTFKSFRPSLNLKDVQKFESMYKKFSDPKAVQDISKQKQTLN
ncbi:AAA family ATPase (macronuclear) [Tetrahymena thermophila SB210]|uniref:AAA family ATPase n=1 Tax=Tetrahymena thermophila (strain SB210) TaxID=312017 RepID=Q22W60_TETTS|nr:AAA family ATPase [Tetrahymena thermophila SB210]EAR89557.2 AAA family ATPase [Tetrahymena thermophila SB210]|eukprot:XP_001009802.2 AAA family ATPase [Tetrahymena thermophila SB210]